MFKKGTKSAIRRIAEVVRQSTVASPKFTETSKNESELMINSHYNSTDHQNDLAMYSVITEIYRF